MRRLSWLGLILLAGCGGTTTNDGVSPYNRGAGSDYAPTSTMMGAPSANEVVAVDAFLNVGDIRDAKQAGLAVDGLKKLTVPPKRVFLIGATLEAAEWFKKPLSDAKISAVPVLGPSTKEWDKVLKTLSANKIYGNGPTIGGPNADLLATDQKSSTSTAVYDGVRFFFLNTDTPLKTPKEGSIPRLWFLARQKEMKENSAVVVGFRSLRALGKDDPTPVISTADILAKESKVKLFVSASSKSPDLSRPDEKSVFNMAVGGAVGDDKLPHVGIVEVRKNGALYSKIVKLDLTKAPVSKLEATLFEPMSMSKPTINKDSKSVGPTRDSDKTPANDATNGPTTDQVKTTGGGN
ncbi:MAG: hypothetical protein JST12_00360 [Armatimonadetes bacterium]|nr:hypothetical protein [Armatimonadota bacterium]